MNRNELVSMRTLGNAGCIYHSLGATNYLALPELLYNTALREENYASPPKQSSKSPLRDRLRQQLLLLLPAFPSTGQPGWGIPHAQERPKRERQLVHLPVP